MRALDLEVTDEGAESHVPVLTPPEQRRGWGLVFQIEDVCRNDVAAWLSEFWRVAMMRAA